MLRRCCRRLGSTNRYTDGSGRQLESNVVPRDLFKDSISNRAYPVQGEHWQPVVSGQPSPHKGNAMVSGGGVVGLTVASLFALRGWHTTVLEKSPPLSSIHSVTFSTGTKSHQPDGTEEEDGEKSGTSSSALKKKEAEEARERGGFAPFREERTSYRGPLFRPQFGETPTSSSAGSPAVNPSSWSPFIELQYALLTRRAVDALEAAGVRLPALRPLGVRVTGVLDHPGAYNSWLTWRLTEHHPFATNMLSTDLFALRRVLEEHVARGLPNGNLQIFHEQVVEAVLPARQQVVVRAWKGSAAARAASEADSLADHHDAAGVVQQARTPSRKDTSLTISSVKWEKKFAKDAVDYDLLIGADGVNSHLRDLLDVEGFQADIDMGQRWFLLRCDSMSSTHIHRWLHKRRENAVPAAHLYHIRSAYQVPMTLAFPRIEAGNLFSVMIYAPMSELAALSDAEALRRYLPDSKEAELVSFSPRPTPLPTVFCEHLHNSVGLPSAVLVGDAAHFSHPFWMQSLALGLEDGTNLVNQVDAYSRHFYDAVKQYSDERGVSGDAMREMTDRCLYYARKKHANPFLRFQNSYQRFMNIFLPRGLNTMYEGSVNHLYSKSIEEMLNSRGYTSYDYAEKQQSKHRLFYHLGRVYT